MTTAEFLLGIYKPNAAEAEMKNHLQTALEGNPLKVKDANYILQMLLTAMIIDNNEGDKIINKELEENDDETPRIDKKRSG